LGAAVTTLVLLALGLDPFGGEATYLPAGVLSKYWTTITVPSLIVTAVASLAGALVVASNRSVLTIGVMIALALVPTAAITSMALLTGDWLLAGRGLLRWLIEVSSVAVFSTLILAWKQRRVQHRKMML
jgi:uncharacterized membrane protein